MLLFVGAVVVAVLGLSRSASIRRSVPFVTTVFLAGSIVVTAAVYRSDSVETSGLILPMLGGYAKALIAAIGILLVMVAGSSIDRKLEEAFDSGRAAFDPIRVMRGEFFAFFLLSIAGTMLIANSSDLIWLFLALELASLPTYVMVAVSRGTRRAQEAAVKYFFLGALSAAIFLYGFALLYGATGTLNLLEMRERLTALALTDAGMPTLAIIGGVLATLGISFKLAAVPMHFYAPDVYEGASAPTTAFLGFIPKIGGALLQRNIKRMLAYSSIAQSGYLLIGIITGPGAGFDSILFYLVGYGVMNTTMFAVLASLERQGEEVETLDDLSGLRVRQPVLAWMFAIAAIGLIGIPPLIGFFGKLALFAAAIDHGHTELVIVAAVTTAISAYYYLQLVAAPLLGQPNARTDSVHAVPSAWPRIAAVICGIGVLVMPAAIDQLVTASAATNAPSTANSPDGAAAVAAPALVEPAMQAPAVATR
jgi:NADH-quinone oxidoreductase subunit N